MRQIHIGNRVLKTWWLLALTAVLPQVAQSTQPPQPLSLRAASGVDPDRFRSTVFASGLHFPYGMQQLEDGSLLVGTSRPLPSRGYFQSIGELIRLRDRDGDGRADGVPEVLYSGLPGMVTAVRKSGALIFVTSAEPGRERISIFRQRYPLGRPFELVGAMHFAFPAGWEHTSYALAVRRRGNVHEVFFNVGSSANDGQTSRTVPVSGLTHGALQGASLYRVVIQDLRSSLSVSAPERIAGGLRNAAGIALDPGNGDLFFQDNGIDDTVNRSDQRSADELNRLPREAIGGPVEFFGFPDNYVEYRTGAIVGGMGMQPVCAFQPLGSPPSESEGATDVAFAPRLFPAALRGGLFINFFGEYGKAGLANAENPVVFCDPATGRYMHLIGNDEPDVGHMSGLLGTLDSLFLSDLSHTGKLGQDGAVTGVIYQIKAMR
ncbi:MAG: hypothetical protein M3485_04220 [Pseudomonadota bacterium]|nr:hypothetical protein [Pseudomonadota bacterium]